MTPEGLVKKQIDKVLKAYEPKLWWHKPVQNGMGVACLDYHCCYDGWYFAIEAKAPGKELTLRQEITVRKIQAANGRVFIIDGASGVTTLATWLDSLK